MSVLTRVKAIFKQIRIPVGGLYIGGVKVTATANEINTGTVAGLTATATELNQLHSQGAVAADFAKLHALTPSAADINTAAYGAAGAAISANGAISQKQGTVVITKAGVAALTIADPTATTDDFKVLRIISVTANAHTLDNSAGSGFNGGGAASDVGTFGGAKGDNIVLMAYQGVWYVISKVNVTLA